MRLSNKIKRELVETLIARAFGGRKKELGKIKTEWADAYYESLYSEEERTLLSSIPEGWMRTTDSVIGAIPGLGMRHFYFSNPVRIHYDFYRQVSPSAETELGKRFRKIIEAENRLEKEAYKREKELDLYLKNFSTVKSLLGACPELADYIGCNKGNAEIVPTFLKTTIGKKSNPDDLVD